MCTVQSCFASSSGPWGKGWMQVGLWGRWSIVSCLVALCHCCGLERMALLLKIYTERVNNNGALYSDAGYNLSPQEAGVVRANTDYIVSTCR